MLIHVNALTKELRHCKVLDNINLEFCSGKIYGIVGANGSGKTMLLRALSGLIRPTSGEIIADGRTLHKDMDFPPDMGLLIEKPELLEQFSGLENLKMLAGIKNKISEAQIIEWMQRFSLDAHSKQPVRKYSLGMKQKLGIVQALMEEPRLLILDEPFNALDAESARTLREVLLQCKEQDRLIILTSHHAEDIALLCDEAVEMQSGKALPVKTPPSTLPAGRAGAAGI